MRARGTLVLYPSESAESNPIGNCCPRRKAVFCFGDCDGVPFTQVNHMEKKCAELEASVAQTHAEMRELNSALQRTTSETAILVEELEHSREEVKRLTRELEVSSTSSTDSARMKALTNTSLSTSESNMSSVARLSVRLYFVLEPQCEQTIWMVFAGMVATLFPEPTDRRETLADVEERILRDQLLSAQETLNQVQEQRDALDAEKAALVQEKAQLQEVFQHTKQASLRTRSTERRLDATCKAFTGPSQKKLKFDLACALCTVYQLRPLKRIVRLVQEVAELQTRCGEWERRTQQAEAQRAELDSQLQLTSSTLQATINQLKQQVLYNSKRHEHEQVCVEMAHVVCSHRFSRSRRRCTRVSRRCRRVARRTLR